MLVSCFSPFFSTIRLALPIGKSDMLVSGSVPHQKVEQGVETRNFLATPGTEVYGPNCRGASNKTHRLLVIHPCTGECRACIVKLPWLSDLHGTTTTCRSCPGLESRNPLLGDPDLDGADTRLHECFTGRPSSRSYSVIWHPRVLSNPPCASATVIYSRRMTDVEDRHDGDRSPLFLSPSKSDTQDTSLWLPKNKSTGNLLSRPEEVPGPVRIRFSFDAGTLQEMNELAK